MYRFLLIGLYALLLMFTSGCSHRNAEEIDARLESAEANAATARLRADQVDNRLERVEAMAAEALRIANQNNEQLQRLKKQSKHK
ncbi:hypothetical protein D3C77_483390 [compost metagenome]